VDRVAQYTVGLAGVALLAVSHLLMIVSRQIGGLLAIPIVLLVVATFLAGVFLILGAAFPRGVRTGC
jgi:hypothetical protein